jgi:putative ABC transport system permease protein
MNFLQKSIRRSIIFYSRNAVNQVIIVLLLSAIIAGSLFTGHSVRASLRKSSSEKLGNTGILISSGLRYFNGSLAERISAETGEKTIAILETEGYCQNFKSGATALNTKIYGITEGFWSFQGIDSVSIKPGTVAVNNKLARQLGISVGDEIIVRFQNLDPIPVNAPFAPSGEENISKVLKVGQVVNPQQAGNFSTGISQIAPMNIFINMTDLNVGKNDRTGVNRLLVQNKSNLPVNYYYEALRKQITPSDIGLTVRRSKKTGEPELISDRIFIDSAIVSNIVSLIPSARPVITYLGNDFSVNGNSTPYSFISAFGDNIGENDINITKWMADDLDAKAGDTLVLTWYDPAYSINLGEKSESFIISQILSDDHLYSDPSLMPDFPGISGSTSCSGWDAGIPILMEKIREKDEEYWNKYRGTPKAFLTYETGKRLWGNNFGPATALRFSETLETESITKSLAGSLDPKTTGFIIEDVQKNSDMAAGESIDFSTLFLSLAVFIIVSCIILLSLAVSMFFDTRKEQLRTYFALGFKNSYIRKLLLSETMVISISGAVPGVFLGYLLNILTIKALNSVWSGAVQTNTLTAHFSIVPLLIGFLAAETITSFLLLIKTNKFLESLRSKETGELKRHQPKNNLILLIISLVITLIIVRMSLVIEGGSVALSFAGGALIFITLVLLLRQYCVRKKKIKENIAGVKGNLSKQFYSFHPAHMVTPVIFIAAGIFAVMITGANKKVVGDKMLLPPGGTGGYLLWAESAVPVKENLNGNGRKELGLDEEDLKELVFVQARRLPGDDASCLNLNHITTPAILGIDPSTFINRGSFSFATRIKKPGVDNPWSLLEAAPGDNVIYGITDQTVLQWGLKIKTGDTLVFNAENGQPLKIVICAGLKSSLFQGYLIIGSNYFEKYYPSVPGSSVFLIDGDPASSDYYREVLSQRLSGYGLSIEKSGEKLASFQEVTNTYLDVFVVLGVFGMVLGAAGLGFILILNFNRRKREFALMMATGYNIRRIRGLLLKDQLIMLFWGILTGTFSGLLATLPSLRSGSEIPWSYIPVMIVAVSVAGLSALLLSLRRVKSSLLILLLREE